MNPSYCRIRVPMAAAVERFAVWNRLPRVGPLVPTDSGDAIRLAVETMEICLLIARLEKQRGRTFAATNACRRGLAIAVGCTRQTLLEPEVRKLEAEMRS